MNTITYPSGVVAELPPLPPRKFTLDEYHNMLAAGTLKSGDPFELLEGWIVPKMSRNSAHDVALDIGQEAVRTALPEDWRLRIQSAVTLDSSEPEPDMSIVQGPGRRYLNGHPRPADIAVVIEISDSSLSHDRTNKGRIYARAGIPVYWIVNVADEQIEVYADPTGDVEAPEYRQRTDYRSGESVPLTIAGQTVASIPADDLLP